MNFFYCVFVVSFVLKGLECECLSPESTTLNEETYATSAEDDEYYYYDDDEPDEYYYEDYGYDENNDDNEYGDYSNISMPFMFLISGGVRSFAGREAIKGMVSLRTRSPRKYFGDNHFCSGVIITPNVVLTAAHCVMDKSKVMTAVRRILVVAGTPNRLEATNTTVQMPVKTMRAHPSFESKGTHDIALIFLKDSFPDNNTEIRVNTLPSKPFLFAGICMTLGWGRLYYNGPMSARPVTLFLTIDSPNECSRLHKGFAENGLLCASDPVQWYKDPCRGDSGGGLFCEGVLRGIISWTISCGSSEIPSLFTDVHYNLEWIEQEIAKGLACRWGTHFAAIFFSLIAFEINFNF